MADREVDVLIAGAGAAGATCAETLAEQGFTGSVLLVGRESDPPYERPYGSKDYLRGDLEREATYLHPLEWWAENGVELLTRTSVMKLDTEARTAKLSNKEEIALRAGRAGDGRQRAAAARARGGARGHPLPARARQRRRDPPRRGRRLERRADRRLLHRLRGGREPDRAWASSARWSCRRRCRCAPASARRRGASSRACWRSTGSSGWAPTGSSASRARGEGEGDAPGRVERVVTTAGRTLDADLVVMGTGAMPDVMLARAAGLELGETGGVACSSRAGDLGAGRVGGGRQLRVRLGRARAPAADRALGGGARAGPGRGARARRASRPTSPRCPTSGPTSPTGARSSTSARRASGTPRSCAARWTRASSRSSTSRRPAGGRPHRRALGRPRPRAPVPTERHRPRRRARMRWPTRAPTWRERLAGRGRSRAARSNSAPR